MWRRRRTWATEGTKAKHEINWLISLCWQRCNKLEMYILAESVDSISRPVCVLDGEGCIWPPRILNEAVWFSSVCSFVYTLLLYSYTILMLNLWNANSHGFSLHILNSFPTVSKSEMTHWRDCKLFDSAHVQCETCPALLAIHTLLFSL